MWGQSALNAMNDVPGPRIPICIKSRRMQQQGKGVSWVLLLTTLQLVFSSLLMSGLLGGCGQVLEINLQMTEAGRIYHTYKSKETAWIVQAMDFYYRNTSVETNVTNKITDELDALHSEMLKVDSQINGKIVGTLSIRMVYYSLITHTLHISIVL